jgi:hypothetical protein
VTEAPVPEKWRPQDERTSAGYFSPTTTARKEAEGVDSVQGLLVGVAVRCRKQCASCCGAERSDGVDTRRPSKRPVRLWKPTVHESGSHKRIQACIAAEAILIPPMHVVVDPDPSRRVLPERIIPLAR